MPDLRTTLLAAVSFSLLTLTASPSFAEDRSFYSPVIYLDTEDHRILISTLGSVFYIDVPEAARPHMEKLQVSTLVDFVVEIRGEGQMPVLKTWKVKSGDTTCKYFDGKGCK